MADNCDYVPIHFGTRFGEKWKCPSFWGLLKGEKPSREKMIEVTGSLWDFTYRKNSDLAQYSGQADPVSGPDCSFTPFARGCFAAPTGADGHEGKSPHDYITLKPGVDSFLYLDIGFWGNDKRDFGLVCGPHAWLCSYGAGAGTPTPETFHEQHLCNFHRELGNFKVLSNGTVNLHKDDFGGLALKIYVLLPDMHMWPDPVGLSKNSQKFFNPSETAALKKAIADGRLIYGADGALRVPDLPAGQTETPIDREIRFVAASRGLAANKANHLADVAKMKAESEGEHAFGSMAGGDLEQFLNAIEKARTKGYDIQVVQAGDLLELWAPVPSMLDENPFNDAQWISFTQTTRKRLPLLLELIYENPQNRRALDALKRAGCFHIYGNHDVYLSLDWEQGKSPLMNGLMGTWGYFSENLLWVEHGQRFQPNNRDGYWIWKDLLTPPGRLVTELVNYYPFLRKLEDRFDNPVKNLYAKNVPYASIWYILGKEKWVKWKDTKRFSKPDKFRIFVQGHTHKAILLKIYVNFAERKKSVGARTGRQKG